MLSGDLATHLAGRYVAFAKYLKSERRKVNVDFVAERHGEVAYYQVSYLMPEEKTATGSLGR